MADATTQVYRNFRFKVTVDDIGSAAFSEASGFDATYDVVEYRAGDDSYITPQKFPGLIKYGNITLKRGVSDSNEFYAWIEKGINGGINKTETMTIELMDNTGDTAVATWTVRNVWAVKYTGPDLNGNASEIAMETLELAHEGIKRES